MIAPAPVVAAIGDSITYGHGLASPQTQAFPYVVGRDLGARRVVDLGVPGTDVEYAIANEVPKIPRDATVVLIFEGTNEMWPVIDRGKDGGSPSFDTHVRAYKRLIAAVRERLPHARLVLINVRNYGYDGQTFFKGESQAAEGRFTLNWDAMVNTVAAASSSAVVDLRCDESMYDRALFSDGIHPTAQGQRRIASDIEAALAHAKTPPANCAPFAPPEDI
jgi:lysophospholipase L1-like esterase